MTGEASAEKAEAVPASSCHFFGDGGTFLVRSGPCAEAHLEVAAELLEERLGRLNENGFPDWIDFQVGWADALETAHRELADDLSRRDLPTETDLSITCTALVLGDEQFYLAHLGRGRPMLYRRKFLQQLGKEHTEAFEALGKGEIKSSELPNHPGARRLTRGLGIPEEDAMMATAAAFKKGMAQIGDRFLIPAAEVLAYTAEEHLLEALELDDAPVDACTDLVTKAREAGAPGAGCLMVEVVPGATSRWGAADEGDPIPEPPPARPKPPPPEPEPEEGPPEVASEDSSEALDVDPLDDVPSRPPLPPDILAALGGVDPEAAEDAEDAEEAPPLPADLAVDPPALDEERPQATPGATASPPRAPEPASKQPPPRLTSPRPPPRVDLPEPDRWVDIERTSHLDTTFAVGAALLISILLMAGLFWESLFRH